VLFELNRIRDAVFDGPAQCMKWSSAWISSPTENEPAHASRADQLVVDQIRCQPAKRQFTTSLPNDFVARGKANEMCEAFDDDRVAVVNKTGDCVSHRHQLAHGRAFCHRTRIRGEFVLLVYNCFVAKTE